MGWIAAAVGDFGWVQTYTYLVVVGMLSVHVATLLLIAIADGLLQIRRHG